MESVSVSAAIRVTALRVYRWPSEGCASTESSAMMLAERARRQKTPDR
jgi:hypothetical protein